MEKVRCTHLLHREAKEVHPEFAALERKVDAMQTLVNIEEHMQDVVDSDIPLIKVMAEKDDFDEVGLIERRVQALFGEYCFRNKASEPRWLTDAQINAKESGALMILESGC